MNAIIIYELVGNVINTVHFQTITKKNGASAMKKRTILIVTIILFLMMLPLIAGAEIVDSGTCGDNLTWTLDDKGLLVICGNGAMNNFTSEYETPWRENIKSIRSLIIQDGVTSIGNCAFSDCENLQSIIIPNNLDYLGMYAFFNCKKLGHISIPYGISRIGSYAFDQCISLSSIIIPETVTCIGEYAFRDCGILNVSLPSSITYIERNAFQSCQNLTNVYFEHKSEDRVLFDNNIFLYSMPKIYCHEYSDPEGWVIDNDYPYETIENIDLDLIRTIELYNDFRVPIAKQLVLIPYVFPNDHFSVIWSSTKPEVISIDNTGKITALSAGITTIVATVGAISDSINITVFIPATSFDLIKSEEWTIAKDPFQLFPINILPEGSEVQINWHSSDTSYATVDDNGLVITKKPGNVIITASTENNIHRECLLHC